SLADRMSRPQQPREYYRIDDPEIAEFLGPIEKKTKDSVVITLAGEQGSMKTRMLFQLMNAFAQHYRCGHASIEEHPESALYEDKVREYLNSTAMSNIMAPEVDSIAQLHDLVRKVDVVFIDSFAKVQEWD